MVTLLNKMDQQHVRDVCALYANRPADLLEILHTVQKQEGHLSDPVLITIADALNISRAEIHGVVTFYHDFKKQPTADIVVKICRAEACQAVGGEDVALALKNEYTDDRNVDVEDVYCLGNCALGPAVLINDNLYGRVTLERASRLITDHANNKEQRAS